jgi:hypothetical protein
MKIVKFSNGKYGVRKLTWKGYVFAINKSGLWGRKSNNLIQEFSSLEFAQDVKLEMQERATTSNDVGIPIDTTTKKLI